MTAIRRPDVLDWRRVLLGLILTPLLPAFYVAILFAKPWALPVGLLVAYPCELVIGLPILLLLRRVGWMKWWHFGIAGVLSAIPAVVIHWRIGSTPQIEAFSPGNAALTLLWGALAGLCFWLIAVAGASPVRLRDLFDHRP
jgi:hypothetical protein